MGGVAQPFGREAALKRALRAHLRSLGFSKDEAGDLVLPGVGKDVIRKMHRSQRRERLTSSQRFLQSALPRTLPYFANGSELDPRAIALRLRPVRTGTIEADIFRVELLDEAAVLRLVLGTDRPQRQRFALPRDGLDQLLRVWPDRESRRAAGPRARSPIPCGPSTRWRGSARRPSARGSVPRSPPRGAGCGGARA